MLLLNFDKLLGPLLHFQLAEGSFSNIYNYCNEEELKGPNMLIRIMRNMENVKTRMNTDANSDVGIF